jgi:hypothetical protein
MAVRGVEGHRGRAFVGGGPTGLEVGEAVVVEPHPHLHRDGHPLGCVDGSTHDPGEEASANGQRGAAAVASDLGHRAPEVQVDVVDLPGGHQAPHRFAHGDRVGAIQLNRPDLLVGVMARHRPRGLAAFHETARRQHLRDEHPAALFGAQDPERRVGRPGHRGQDHGCGQFDAADAKHHRSMMLAGTRRRQRTWFTRWGASEAPDARPDARR